jgi:hypothetical protein
VVPRTQTRGQLIWREQRLPRKKKKIVNGFFSKIANNFFQAIISATKKKKKFIVNIGLRRIFLCCVGCAGQTCGGCGKTFLCNIILAYVRMQNKIALVTAMSEIAAT